ncbi:MAG: 50S ribosomal protein L11 [candidate division WS6 bacterium GW2011_GWF2_39_15]|uniref:Large ribosomal subunit protein uL11 n=1 Tax=candidate division WS6 bacterium GW2011_GWF2_39_15 TaxID=1619100 RepID=A0A0G0Q7F9_9BACT|nr:MAG: 50S ribosomal protein L11 [candidate division WS6 bacterium GW2011_GWF2_39_15]
MAKKITKVLKLMAAAGAATPAPPLGPTLAPYGISTQQFCMEFNERTRENNGVLTPVVLTIYEDRTFTFITKTPPTSELIRRELKIKAGSAKPNLEKVGKLTMEQVKRIAETKMVDLNTKNIDQAVKIIEGTARQMGVEVVK